MPLTGIGGAAEAWNSLLDTLSMKFVLDIQAALSDTEQTGRYTKEFMKMVWAGYTMFHRF